MEKKKMNLPNKLTMMRLCLVPVVMAVLAIPDAWVSWKIVLGVAAAIFALTAYTDHLDGKIARRDGLITDFGKFMDPVADKFMVIGTMMMIFLRMSHAGMYHFHYSRYLQLFFFITLVAIIFRELAITSLRLVLVNSAGKVVAANIFGKIKTVSQIVCILVLLTEPYFIRFTYWYAKPLFRFTQYFLFSWFTIGVTLLFTVLSGINYIVKNWALFTKDW